MFEQLKMMISKIRELPVKIEKAEEELHRARDRKEETRKRWACSPTLDGTSRKFSTVTYDHIGHDLLFSRERSSKSY
jgi:hypothetical protein